MSEENRIQPQATDVEKAVLGSCLIEAEAAVTVFEMLEADDFYDNDHRFIYQGLRSLFDTGKEVDLISLENILQDNGSLRKVGGSGYLAELTRHVSSSANVDYHCAILKQKTLRRRLITASDRIANLAQDESEDLYDVLDFANKEILQATARDSMRNSHEAPQVITDALEQIHNNQGAKDGITGIPTGLDLDNLTAGWQKSNFIVIAARPSMGKTAFTLHCLKQASALGNNVALLSLETSYKSIGTRLIISEAGINGQKVRRGKLSDEELTRAQEAASKLLDMGIIVDDTTNLSAASLRAKGKLLKKKYDIQMLAIDFIQLMVSEKDVREQQVAEISRTCKLLCKELDIPVLGLSQLNRGCESRPGFDKRPQLSDLRESGAIEQDADVCISLFRPEYYGIRQYPESDKPKWKGKKTEGICEIIVNKQKDGPVGMIRQIFDKKSMQFRNYIDKPSGIKAK